MKRYFRDKTGGMDLSTEVYSNDVELAAESTEEYEEQRIWIPAEVVEDFQKQVTKMLITDLQYTGFGAAV